MVSFFLLLECLNEIWANFDFFAPTVLNFGQFDDETLFGNESNLHTKIAFIHNILHPTHNVRPAVSLSVIEWSTHSVFTALAWKKLTYEGQNRGYWYVTPQSWSICCRHSSADTGNGGNYHLTGGGHESFDFVDYASHVCRSGHLLAVLA